MNHLVDELLPRAEGGRRLTNSDPIIGQAAWYDLKVRITPAADGEEGLWPAFPELDPLPGAKPPADTLRCQTHPAVALRRRFRDVLLRK